MGAYAMSTLYGRSPDAEPRPSALVAQQLESQCAPCPACRTCAPPVDCDVSPPVIGPQETRHLMELEGQDGVDTPSKPGLPVSALQAAVRGVKSRLETCTSATVAVAWSGSLVADLTVTATAGVARISNARIIQTEGEVDGFGSCFLDAAQAFEFEWPHEDGEGRVRQAFSVQAK
jgi:hypothetical protein